MPWWEKHGQLEAQVDQDMKKEQDRKAGTERKTQKVFEDQWSLRKFFLGMYIGTIHHIMCNCVFKDLFFIVCVSINEKKKQEIKYMEIQHPQFLRPPPHIITKHPTDFSH